MRTLVHVWVLHCIFSTLPFTIWRYRHLRPPLGLGSDGPGFWYYLKQHGQLLHYFCLWPTRAFNFNHMRELWTAILYGRSTFGKCMYIYIAKFTNAFHHQHLRYTVSKYITEQYSCLMINISIGINISRHMVCFVLSIVWEVLRKSNIGIPLIKIMIMDNKRLQCNTTTDTCTINTTHCCWSLWRATRVARG